MASESKRGYASSLEADSHDLHLRSKVRTLGIIDAARTGLTLLALLMAITVLGVSAHSLTVYDNTHLSSDFLLPLWPDNFDLRPTVALVVGSTIVILVNAASLLSDKVPFIRSKSAVRTAVAFAAPLAGLVVALSSTIVFYAANSSATDDTLLSWACRWDAVPMLQQPHFGTLCNESRAGLYMSVLLIPLEALVLAAAGWQLKVERYATAYAHARKDGPVIS